LGLEINKALGKKQQTARAWKSSGEQSGTEAAHYRYTTDLHPPNTRIRVASTVYGSSQLHSVIDKTAWRNRSLGHHAPRVTHRAFSHTLADKLDR
jgi:hypothetical protein